MSAPGLIAVQGVARDYAWGSRTYIPALLGRPSTDQPVAELWFGAHPESPSPVSGGGLDELLARDPVGWLGAGVVGRFGPRLPFLLKLLAAEQPLSIQVHPDRVQAQAGFAAEEARGVPRAAPNRNYRDDNHKPELLYALTPFDALCGFRPVEATLRLLDLLAVPVLDPVAAALGGPGGLRAAFSALLEQPDPAPAVAQVAARASELGEQGEFALSLRAVRTCAAAFPGDVGVLLSLLLNAVTLQPGESIYLGAGNVHAYLHGLGVEIMANSDNVLRCGLTPKHVDVAELLAITDFTPLAEPRWAPSPSPAGSLELDVPVPDFRLGVYELADSSGPVALPSIAPQLVLGLSGRVRVEAGGQSVPLGPGEAVFAPPDGTGLTLHGHGRLAIAGVGTET